MSNNKNIGPILTAIGLLVGITAASKKAPLLGEFPDTTFVALIGVVIALAGVILWRQSVNPTASSKHDLNTQSGESLRERCSQARSALQQLVENDNSDIESRYREIDAFVNEHLLAIEMQRSDAMTNFGLSRGTEFLSNLALVERLVNRAHSTSADGHRGETHASLEKALLAMNQLIEWLNTSGQATMLSLFASTQQNNFDRDHN